MAADSPRRAVYLNGIPTNLEAAALDALDWLEFWQRALDCKSVRDGMSGGAKAEMWRFEAAIEVLRSFLPTDEEPIYNETPKEAPDASR